MGQTLHCQQGMHPPQLGGGGKHPRKVFAGGGSEIPILVEGEGVILLGGHVILK